MVFAGGVVAGTVGGAAGGVGSYGGGGPGAPLSNGLYKSNVAYPVLLLCWTTAGS